MKFKDLVLRVEMIESFDFKYIFLLLGLESFKWEYEGEGFGFYYWDESRKTLNDKLEAPFIFFEGDSQIRISMICSFR